MQHFNRYAFGVAIKRWREKNDFSQFELAACSGVTPAFISSLERFIDHDHQMYNIAKVCDAIEVDIRDFFSEFKDR